MLVTVFFIGFIVGGIVGLLIGANNPRQVKDEAAAVKVAVKDQVNKQ